MPEPAQLRLLRRLVTTLMAVMIAGFLVIVGLFVIRLSGTTPTRTEIPALPDAISLPDGAHPQAVTFGHGWIAVVSEDGRILIYDAGSGALRQEIKITQNP